MTNNPPTETTFETHVREIINKFVPGDFRGAGFGSVSLHSKFKTYFSNNPYWDANTGLTEGNRVTLVQKPQSKTSGKRAWTTIVFEESHLTVSCERGESGDTFGEEKHGEPRIIKYSAIAFDLGCLGRALTNRLKAHYMFVNQLKDEDLK